MTIKKFQTIDGIASNGAVIISNTTSISANLTVDTDTLFVDAVNNRVGVGRVPTSKLDVDGTVNATAFVGDGSGLTGVSGGDAGTLDGLDSTDFLRSNASDTFQDGQLSFSNASIVVGTSTLRMNDNQTIGLGTGSDGVLFGNNAGMWYTGSNANFNAATLFVDTTNNRIGIGKTNPATKLDINGAITVTGGTSTQWNTAYSWGDHSAAGYITSVTAGTGLTGSETSGAVTLNVAGLTVTEFSGGSIQTSAEGFSDVDNVLMTAAAIEDRILSKGYGTITNISAGTGLTGGGSTGAVSLAVDLSELVDMTETMIGADEFIVLDGTLSRRKAANEIGLSIFNNDAGYTTNAGDITSVSTGTGLDGSATSGAVTISLDFNELPDLTTDMSSTDQFIIIDFLTEKRKAISEIGLSLFNNDAGFVTSDTTYSAGSGLNLTGTTFSADFGTTADTVAEGNDGRFVNGFALGSGTTSRQFTINRPVGNLSVTLNGANTTSAGLVTTGNQTWGGTKTSANFAATSDIRLKTDIHDYTSEICFDKVIQLTPKQYTWKESGKTDIGLIAQEVEEIFPEYVHTDENGYKAINYSKLTTVLIGAIKDLSSRIESLENK